MAARGGANAPAALLWDRFGSDDAQEMLVLLRPRVFDQLAYVLALRAADDLTDGLFAALFPVAGGTAMDGAHRLAVYERTAGVESAIVSISLSRPLVEDSLYFLRFRVEEGADPDEWLGLQVASVRYWEEGAVEPAEWDARGGVTVSGGRPGFALSRASQAYDLFAWSIADGGLSADLSALPRSLAAVLADSGATSIGILVEIEAQDFDTGEVVSLLASKDAPLNVGDGDVLPAASVPPLLAEIGTLSAQLSGDLQFGGEGIADPGILAFRNNLGQTWSWLRYTIGGRRAIVRMGERGKPVRAWEIVRANVAQQEPQVGSAAGTRLKMSNVNAQLAQPILVRTFSGLPTAVNFKTVAGTAAAPHLAAYDMTAFTAVRRFRIASAPALNGTLLRKQLTSSNRQMAVGMLAGTGILRASFSTGGVFTPLPDTVRAYADDVEHVLVFSTSGSYSYLMVDGLVVSELSGHGPPDTQAAALEWGLNWIDGGATSYLGEIALLSGYTSPVSSRTLTLSRVRPDLPNVVGLWSGDDGGGPAITDYGPLANNAVLTGVENTDYAWVPTDQGDPAYAGKAMPTLSGLCYNRKGEPVDAVRGRYRFSDRAVSVGAAVLRSRGGVLAFPADYSLTTDGAAASVSATEPVGVSTVLEGEEPEEFSGATADPPEAHVAGLIATILRERTALVEEEDWSAGALRALHRQIPMRAGIGTASGEKPAVGALLTEQILQPLGGHLRVDADGRLIAGLLLRTVNPGPFGVEGLLEFCGDDDTGVRFGQVAFATPTDHGIAAWVMIHCGAADLTQAGVTVGGIPTGFTIWDRLDAAGETGAYLGVDSSRPGSIVFGHPEVLSDGGGLPYLATPAETMRPGVYYLVIAEFQQAHFVGDTGIPHRRTVRVYDRQLASWQTFQQDCTSAFPNETDSLNPLTIGGGRRGPMLGCIARVQAWSGGVTLDDEQVDAPVEQLAAPPGLLFLAPLTEGRGNSCTDVVAQERGRITGARWSPREVFDLRRQSTPTLADVHNLAPLSSVRIGYKRNGAPLQEADIAVTIVGPPRTALKIPVLEVADGSNHLAETWRTPRSHDRDSVLVRRADAQAVLQQLAERIPEGTLFVQLEGVQRRGVTLTLTDEVVVYADTDPAVVRGDFSNGRAFRVVGISSALDSLTSSLVLAGGAPGIPLGEGRITDEGGGRVTDEGSERRTD